MISIPMYIGIPCDLVVSRDLEVKARIYLESRVTTQETKTVNPRINLVVDPDLPDDTWYIKV